MDEDEAVTLQCCLNVRAGPAQSRVYDSCIFKNIIEITWSIILIWLIFNNLERKKGKPQSKFGEWNEMSQRAQVLDTKRGSRLFYFAPFPSDTQNTVLLWVKTAVFDIERGALEAEAEEKAEMPAKVPRMNPAATQGKDSWGFSHVTHSQALRMPWLS